MSSHHVVPTALSQLQPTVVWQHFDALCQIPRPSKNEAAVVQHITQWAQANHIAAWTDAAGNVHLTKPASPGKEQAPGVILQSHLDMVCQKNNDSSHDFLRDPIETRQEDGWLVAPGTTLGADNGIGVALIMATLADNSLVHGPLHALLTVDEEAGMGGALGLAPGSLKGSLMINLDTEEWGEFYLGCAGGLDVNVARPGTPQALPAGYQVWRISVSGLRGGHSGINIHEGRGNAIRLLVRGLQQLASQLPMRLASLQGGTARNALPREAHATVALPAGSQAALQAWVQQFNQLCRTELAGVEDKLSVQITPSEDAPVLHETEQAIWLSSLHAAPYGVERMSTQVPGVVETSNNLGVVSLTPEQGSANFLVRSLIDTRALELGERISHLFALSQSQVEITGQYPGWSPNAQSALLQTCQSVYKRLYGAQAHVQVIHAGLECGILSAKHPGVDIISFGPTIRGAHAPGERVQIDTVSHCWDLLRAILAQCAN